MANKTQSKNTLDPNEEFPKVQNLVYDIAWTYTRRYGLDFEEAKAEACLGFAKAITRYDPNNSKGAKLSTLVYFLANCRLRRMVMDRVEGPKYCELNLDIEHELEAPPERCAALEAIEDLSDDAKTIVQLLLEAPQELLEDQPTPRQLFERVKDYLTWTQGRPHRKVKQACRELRTRLQEVWA